MHTLHTLPEKRLHGGLRARVWEGIGLVDDDTLEVTHD